MGSTTMPLEQLHLAATVLQLTNPTLTAEIARAIPNTPDDDTHTQAKKLLVTATLSGTSVNLKTATDAAQVAAVDLYHALNDAMQRAAHEVKTTRRKPRGRTKQPPPTTRQAQARCLLSWWAKQGNSPKRPNPPLLLDQLGLPCMPAETATPHDWQQWAGDNKNDMDGAMGSIGGIGGMATTPTTPTSTTPVTPVGGGGAGPHGGAAAIVGQPRRAADPPRRGQRGRGCRRGCRGRRRRGGGWWQPRWQPRPRPVGWVDG